MDPQKLCCLCGKGIGDRDDVSRYRVEGEARGFSRAIDLERAFHNACLTRTEGINEIARAQVLDYLEAVQFNSSVLQDLQQQNLDRAQKLLKQIEWRAKYDPPKSS